MSLWSSFITAFMFPELCLHAGMCSDPCVSSACIYTWMYLFCPWRSPGLSSSVYLVCRVRVIIISISQIRKLGLYMGPLGMLASGQG